MPELSLRDITLAFGGAPLLEGVDLQVEPGERICLLGRNGAGKTTLLRLLAGELPPDGGTIDRRQGVRTAILPQDVPQSMVGTVAQVVAGGWTAGGEAWERDQQVDQVIDRLGLPAAAPMDSLSGGMKRRVLLGRALVSDPDVLLLDEPTNHLDIDSIAWLEETLLRARLTLIFVTHDRAFLRRMATRIVEIDRGRLYDFAVDYDTFLRRKEELLNAEEKEWARFDRKLAQEEAWIRQGIQARRTRNEGRVRALKAMREERRERRERTGTAKLQIHEGERSGKLVAEVEGIAFGYDDRPLVRDFSTTVLRGDRIGVIGPNGAGKTTLLKLLLGTLTPQAGRVRHGTNLQVLYFDQMREQLDPDRTVQQNLAGDQELIYVGGRARHVVGYLQEFLFTPDRIRTPVRVLSGGERSRLLLARLFAREANVLVLDEPTNDLDLETLDLLEELLADFGGTVFLVSHDRDFLNRVVTSTLVFEGEGRVAEYVGGYDDWLRQRPAPETPAPVAKPKAKREKPRPERPRKLTFKERQELAGLPARIEALEAEQAALHGKMAAPEFYREAGEQVAAATERLEQLEAEMEEAFARWEELEAVAERSEAGGR